MSTNDNPTATPETTAPNSPPTVRRKRQSAGYQPKEWKLVPLRECPTPDQMQICDTPERAVAYWHSAVVSNPYFDPERECLVVIILNTRRRIRGHYLVATGTMDTILCHPRDVFRIAIVAGAAALVLAHNHPSGDASPSEADIKITRDLHRAGQLLRIEVLDHVIVGSAGFGNNAFTSLRTLGYLSA